MAVSRGYHFYQNPGPTNIPDRVLRAMDRGAIDFTGAISILLGPNEPSLGGFVCPAVVIDGNRRKLGQLCPAIACSSGA